MAVKIRLKRVGRKKRPFYRIIVADARSPRDGKMIESIGVYQPLSDPAHVEVKEDRALYWLQQGAKPTETVETILSKLGIMDRFSQRK